MILTHGINSLRREHPVFLLLNNMGTLSGDGTRLISEVGPDCSITEGFTLTASNNISGHQCYRIADYDPNVRRTIRALQAVKAGDNRVLTLEAYLCSPSGYYNIDSITEAGFTPFNVERQISPDIYRLQLYRGDTYQLYNGATLHDLTNTWLFIQSTRSVATDPKGCHFAVVIDYDELKAYVFAHGVLNAIITYSSLASIPKSFTGVFAQEAYPVYMGNNFLSIRKGDFSNNRQSFTVPTAVYSPTQPKEVFFEFLSSAVAPETAAHMLKTTKNGVTYEYFDSSISQALYWFEGPISVVEFDVYVSDYVDACDYGIWDAAPIRAHYNFYGISYTPLIAKFSTTGYDSISFPTYSERYNSYYQERAAGSPTEYCKSINLTSMARVTAPKHYKYEVVSNNSIRVSVQYTNNYGGAETASVLLTYADPLSLRYIRMQLESAASGHRDEFAFKNFRILYK